MLQRQAIGLAFGWARLGTGGPGREGGGRSPADPVRAAACGAAARRPVVARLAALLAATGLLAGCGSDPTVGGSAPDPEVEAVAIVRAERLVSESVPIGAPVPGPFDRLEVAGQIAPLVELPATAGPGRQPRAWVASFVADGVWRLVFKAETGPCIIDCAGQRYWYFTVSPLGEPRLEGRYAIVTGPAAGSTRDEGQPRWGFPGDAERRLLATALAGGRRQPGAAHKPPSQ